jgi:arylsulfatase A-like enzyme
MVAAMDEAVGQVIAALEKRGMKKNSLLLFTSDNGGYQPGKVASNGSLRAGKGTLYEGGVRVPACAAWEGRIKPGSVVNEPLHIVDCYPTLVKLTGGTLEQKLPLDGRDAWPTIAEGKPSPHDAILLNAAPQTGALRLGDWKLVLNGQLTALDVAKQGDGTVELFNLAKDPSEKDNLADKMPDKVKELRERYDVLAAEAAKPKYHPAPKGFRSPKIWGEKE